MSREQAKAIIEKLVERFAEHRKEYHLADYNEQKARQDFINPFFKALGWDIDNEKGDSEAYREVIYEDKVVVKGKTKAPDYGFRLTGSGEKRLFYVEAKKPSVAIKINKESAYQLRRYGSSAQAYVSILTNFEDFIIYDCSKVPNLNDSATVARLKHIGFEDYSKEFDFLYDTFSHEAVTKGRFDKYVQASANKKGTDTLDKRFVESLDQWRKYLATSIALNNKKINEEELNFAVQQTIDRLIFLRFCEDRSVEPYGQLQIAASKGDAYKNLLNLFLQADDKYNSGLFDFEKDQITKTLKVDNKVIKSVVEELYYPLCNFEFSVMPVEILGNAYEQFLGKVIRITPARGVKIEEKPEVRKAGGVYYTPQYIVDYIVKNTVGKLIDGKAPKDIEAIKIVDPACGSGSFLVGAYQFLLSYHLDYYYKEQKKLSTIIDHKNTALKEKRDAIKLRAELPLTPDGKLTTKIKKQLLVNNIYGVDLDANATEVSKLSLLLKCMEGETAASVKTITLNLNDRVLPNLDNNILIDTDIYDTEIDFGEEKKIKPFSWKKQFPQVFKQGGFDIVVGNPPYVMLQNIDTKEVFTYCLEKFQSAKYKIDTYQLFIEQSIILLKDKGLLGFITPNTFLKNIHSEPLRKYTLDKTVIKEIVLFKYSVFASASVDTCVFVFEKGKSKPSSEIIVKEAETAFELKTMPSVKQNVFNTNNRKDFNLLISESDTELLNKIVKFSTPLSSFCDAYFGIQTFDRNKFVSDKKINKYYEPVIDGANVEQFYLKNPVEYVNYQPSSIKSGGNALIYRQERICIRQIGSFPVSTIVPANIFTLNTIYNVYLNNKNKIDLRVILGIINSNVSRFFWKKNSSDEKKTFPKIKKEAILSIPIPNFNTTIQKKHIDDVLKNTELLLKLNIELRETKLQTKIEQTKQRIEHSEDKINQLVYELYQLTPEEIAIIEGGNNE
jgi:type I restriction-modification system DNA methylase subunit